MDNYDLEKGNNNKNTEKNSKRSFFSDMYDDFFYLISSNPEIFDKQNQSEKNTEIPRIEIPKSSDNSENINNQYENTDKDNSKVSKANDEKENATQQEQITAKESPEELLAKEEERKVKIIDFYNRIDNSHLSEESKIVLKKMIDYTKKFDEKIVNKYIPFNMRIYSDNDEFLFEVVNIIIDSFTFFHYMKNDEAVQRSFFVVDDSNSITELYTKKNSLIVFKDAHGLLNQEKSIRDKILSVWENTITDYSTLDGITTII